MPRKCTIHTMYICPLYVVHNPPLVENCLALFCGKKQLYRPTGPTYQWPAGIHAIHAVKATLPRSSFGPAAGQ